MSNNTHIKPIMAAQPVVAEPQGRVQRHLQTTPPLTNIQIRYSAANDDSAWDEFLANTPGGHHVQTSFWAQLRAVLGWQAERFIITQDEQIIGGGQILFRALPIPFAGNYGYMQKGPLLPRELSLSKSGITQQVMTAIKQIAKRNHIRYLALMPPDNGFEVEARMPAFNYNVSDMKIGLSATVQLDLTPSLDDIMAKMKSKTRYNTRLGGRKGITVREGTKEDIPQFHQLLAATGERQGFTPNNESYFHEMWRIMAPKEAIKLFLAEYEGETISALLAVPFNGTVIYKRGAWSGKQGKLRPNEVMHWEAIKWAKENGFQKYDFEGINPQAAKALLAGAEIPKEHKESVTRFKVGYGGQVKLFPDTYDTVYNPIFRTIYRTFLPKIKDLPVTKKMLNRIRNN